MIVKILKSFGGIDFDFQKDEIVELDDTTANLFISIGYAEAYTGSAYWGSITGNIDNQLDLKAKFNGKVDKDGAKVLSTYDFNDTYKNKVDGSFQKNNDNSDVITEGYANLFVTPAEKAKWNGNRTVYPVANNTERDALITNPPAGVTVQAGDKSFVVNDGDGKYAEYTYTGSMWLKTGDPDWANVLLDWANVVNKPSTIAGYGITDGAIQGTAYSNLENNVKIVQGVPAGGKMYLGAGIQTGAIKIKLPKAKSNAMFKFCVRMDGQINNNISSSEYIVKGYNSGVGMGNTIVNINTTQQVTVIKDNASTMSPTFYFCTGATEDYILIGEITDTHNFKSVVVDDVEIHHVGIIDDWSKDWSISLVTTLETLTSNTQIAVTPSLNATHLNGVKEDATATANTIVKRDAKGAVTNSQYKLSALNTAPDSATATGTLGEIRIDANYIYVCTATNTWKRTALSTW